MADAVVDYQASSIFGLGANFHCQASTTSTPSTPSTAMDNVGNVECETITTDITSYSQEAMYCGSDFMGDFVDTSGTPVSFLENFGCTFNSKLVDSISINMTKGEKCTVSISGHNHDTNPHDGGATPTGATRADALALGIADVSDFLPHEVAEAFNGWDGFGVPDFGITTGDNATPASASVTFSFGTHADEVDEAGKHFVGKNITPKCELSMEFTGVPTSNTAALLNTDFDGNTNDMLGCVVDSVDLSDGNTSADTFAFVAHAYTDLATV